MIARLLPSLIFQLAAIAVSWPLFVAGFGQGSKYLLAGWWASMLGLVMLGMALMIPLAGLLVGSVASLFFRLPPDHLAQPDDLIGPTLGGGAVYGLGYLATATLLWQFQPGRPSEHADFGSDFIIVGSCVAFAFGFLASLVGVAIIARRMPISLDK